MESYVQNIIAKMVVQETQIKSLQEQVKILQIQSIKEWNKNLNVQLK